jgi:hypothetical protein
MSLQIKHLPSPQRPPGVAAVVAHRAGGAAGIAPLLRGPPIIDPDVGTLKQSAASGLTEGKR